MTFGLLAATITLVAFTVVVLGVSFAVASFAPIVARRLEGYSPASRATLLFQLRILPAAVAGLAALGGALPIFLLYEPRDSEESFPLTFVLIALAGLSLVVRGIVRGALAWRRTSEVRRAWRDGGRRLEGFDTPLPIYAIDEPYPTVAVVGVTRPVLFISEQVLRECSADEVQVMVRHESAHVTVRDNLKRFIIRACPDTLSHSSLLDRAWSSAAEEAADAAAIADRPSAAVQLAEALIHVARLAPARTPALASAFYLGGSIESRVRRLIAPGGERMAPLPIVRGLFVCATLGIAAAMMTAAPALHAAMEVLVKHLP
jgi:beta-lactamase regulating signal transducer with metallopeptidase domain